MAFNTIEYLKKGKVDFVFSLTPYDKESLINYIREADDKNEIIEGFLQKVIDKEPYFCMQIIHDNENYSKEVISMLEKGMHLPEEMILNILTNTSWGIEYFYPRLEEIEKDFKEDTYPKLFMLFMAKYQEFGKYIYYYKTHPNLHIRFLFMKFLLEYFPCFFEDIYPDFMAFLTSVNYQEYEQLTFLPELMANEDICALALLILKSEYKDKYFAKLKEYIMNNYPHNDLATVLLRPELVAIDEGIFQMVRNEKGISEFSKDANSLFLASAKEKFYIAKNYPSLIAKDILEHYLAYYKRFREKDNYVLLSIHSYELGDLLMRLIDKYLSLSKDQTWRFIGSGTTASVYQMGEYVLKLINTKWSYADVICPDLYLIIKNLEEVYIREQTGVVACGIEVQPYLRKEATGVSKGFVKRFEAELNKLGYKTTDELMGGVCGDNCRLLDSYLDANCSHPENLPDWFKQTPMVLVDRDRIFPVEEEYVRQLSSGY